MMMFGRKCPVCGNRQLATRPPVNEPAWLPAAQSLICEHCCQPLLYCLGISLGVERRHADRKQLPANFLVRISGRTNQFARISNISPGGICFDMHYSAPPPSGYCLMLDLYNCNDGSSLEQLAAEIVATCEQMLDINGIKTTVYKQSARFVHLNQAQKKILFSCIQQYGIS